MKEVFVLQFGGKDTTKETLMETARQKFVEAGFDASGIKQLDLYVQPENGKVYYVINEEKENFKGDFDF